MNELIKQIEAEQLKSDIPQFNVGDTIRVYAKVVEGSKERIQMFEGIVIKKQNGEHFAKAIRAYDNGIFDVPDLDKIVKYAGRKAEPLIERDFHC